jgi:hypothetical protein
MRTMQCATWLQAVLVGGTIALGASGARAEDVGEILARMRAALYPPPHLQADLTVRVVNEKGEAVTWGGRFWRATDPPRMRITLDTPADLAGVTVVAQQRPGDLDVFRVTLPFIRRTRIIVHSLRGESFLGTDFNYEDLGFERLDYQEHRLDGEDTIDGHRCWRIDSKPTESWWYGRLLRWIDQETALPLRTDYFDVNGILYKRRTLRDIAEIEGHPTARETEMATLPVHTKTVLTLSDVRYGGTLEPGLFGPQGGTPAK